MKKKLFTTLLALLLFVTLSGCVMGQPNNNNNNVNKTYEITFVENDNCEISLSTETACLGDEVEVYVEDIEDGYEIEKVTANKFLIDLDDDTYIFSMPAEDVEVEVFLKEVEQEVKPTKHNVTYKENALCTISLSKNKAFKDETITVTASDLEEGYEVKFIKVNGFIIDGYTFKMPAEDVEVEVVVDKIEYDPNGLFNIKVVSNDKCNINLSKNSAKKGDEITIIVSNLTFGFEVKKILANGLPIEENSFIMPAMNVKVEVVLGQVQSNVDNEDAHKVSVLGSEYGTVAVEKNKYIVGETVKVNALGKAKYILDKIYVDGVAIEGKSFKMPDNDVVVSATFVNAIPATPWQTTLVSIPTTAAVEILDFYTATASWYFSYGETGVEALVKVEDRFLTEDHFTAGAGGQDNVEVYLTPLSNSSSLVDRTVNGKDEEGKDKIVAGTLHILVSCTGAYYLNTFVSGASRGTPELIPYFSSSVRYTNQAEDGYDGYEVKFTIKYEAFGITKEQALGKMTAALGMRNRNFYNGASNWGCQVDTAYWKNCSKHPLILTDGSYGERS